VTSRELTKTCRERGHGVDAQPLACESLAFEPRHPRGQRTAIVTHLHLGLLPKLEAAGRKLAEQTVAGLTSTTLDQLNNVLADLAPSLTAADAPATDLPRHITRSR
jgi:hypothetical protein